MKVIDLLNKIANGEKVPKKIKYQNYIYEYQHRRDTENCFNYMCNENGEYLSRRYFIDNILNDEVEVIREKEKDRKIRKIKVNYSPDIEEKIFYEDGDKPNYYVLGDAGTELLINKINEIIDYIMGDKHE